MSKIDIRQLENRLITSSKPIERKQIDSNKTFDSDMEKIQNKETEIKFSKHATERLSSRIWV